DRRDFIKTSLLGAAVAAVAQTAPAASPHVGESPGIVDTNVNLFRWPFRRLKYDDTAALVKKLKKHRVVEAWAGSFEALLHKDIAGVNGRLATECRERGDGLLRPIGSANLAWPDWEDDVRRCHETHRMRGIRIYPGYQPFDLSHPDFPRLVRVCHERGLLLQVVFQMEDPRVHHPLLNLPVIDVRPLVAALKPVPEAKVQLLHFSGNVQGSDLNALMTQTAVTLDISRWEGNGSVGKMIGAAPEGAKAKVPVDRVVFGSHVPYCPLETAILRLIESPLSIEQLHAIMYRNAKRLLA
ncbi:MAG: amidohydrolase family protein, partial [Verrucomicrobiota bacterium]